MQPRQPAALSTSELLQEPDQNLVDAVIDSLIEAPVEEIEEATGEVDVIEIDNPAQYWDIEQKEPQLREPQGE